MKIFWRLLALLRAPFRKGESEARLDEEIGFHVDMQTRQNVEAGMPLEAARRAALVSFGGIDDVKEAHRDRLWSTWLGSLLQDVRFGVRRLRLAPGFVVASVATLGLGIGACVAIFSVVNAVLLRPLPFPKPEQLVIIRETFPPTLPDSSVSAAKYYDWEEKASGLERIGALDGMSYNLRSGGDLVHLYAARITASLLPTLGVTPPVGRNFVGEEEIPFDKDNVAMISHRLWQSRFAGRTEVVGSAIELNGRQFKVVGVLPPQSGLPERIDVVTPLAFRPGRKVYEWHGLTVYGRLREGLTATQAEGQLNVLADQMARTAPKTEGWKVRVVPLIDSVVGPARPALLALLAAVGFLLLIACVNVANLLLARATTRSTEMAIRGALGASRRRIIRQLLVESLLLALMGGALGVVIAHGGLAALLALAPETLPRAADIAVDAGALGFTLVLTVLTGVGFGLVPAFETSRVDLHAALKQGGRGTHGGKAGRLRNVLVVAEVAVALWLLAGAGLLMRSFTRLQEVNPGFNPRDAHVAAVFLPRPAYVSSAQHIRFADEAQAKLAALAGVEAVGAAANVPFSGVHLTDLSATTRTFVRPERPPATNAAVPVSSWFTVTPGYFRAMGMSVLRGRPFNAADAAGGHRVVMVSESIARMFFAGEDPLGKLIKLGSGAPCEIVGIVNDVKSRTLDGESRLQTYQPFAQSPDNDIIFVVRTAGPVSGLPEAIQQAIARVDPTVPSYDVRPLDALIGASIARQRFAMTLFAVFSCVALLLAAIGTYSVIAYSVSQRTSELGVRMALGARATDVLRLVFVEGARLIAGGLLVGVVGALLLTRLMEKLLFNVSAQDPVTFVAAVGVMALVGGLGCLLPARQASRIDSMAALRAE